MVRRLCEVRAFSADEMARLLGRGKGYVVRMYLTPMVRDGELEFTIPDSPAHPKQCYRVPGRNEPESEGG